MEINTSKYYLGSICKRGHNYNSTGKSLRNLNKRDCVECKRLKNAERRQAKSKLSGNYLGVLCKRNHEFNNTGMSLRRRKTDECVECHKLRSYGKKQSSYYCPDYFRYRTWLRNPRISLSVAQLISKQEKQVWKNNRYERDQEYREKRKSNYRNKYKSHPEVEKSRNELLRPASRGHSIKTSVNSVWVLFHSVASRFAGRCLILAS